MVAAALPAVTTGVCANSDFCRYSVFPTPSCRTWSITALCGRRNDVATYQNYIDGSWVGTRSGRTFENRNPANCDDLIGEFQDSTTDDVDAAIAAAARAYERWRLVPAPKRAEILFAASRLIEARKDALARDMTREMGKVLEETRGDVQEAIDMTLFMAAEGRRLYGQTVPSELRDKFAMSLRQPLGV